ncbi:MAG: hypothetical protein C4519_02320 [Desulfobacteraceae bacterium]|nr:MAG: hypothetical protein C4519_02320 [Desulfobacteraceae bacterium]
MSDAPTAVRTAPAPSFTRPVAIFTVPVDRDAIFSNHKGVYKRRIENRQRKLIVKSTFIRHFLQPGEHIRCLTTGYSPVSAIEQTLTGPAFLFFKRALLVFTDRRILHIPTRFNRSPRGAISQIAYEDCALLDIKGRSLQVRYKNGPREVFSFIGRMEKKKLRLLLSGLRLSPHQSGRLQGRVHLCPGCTCVLPAAATCCGSCRLAFKTPFKARLWSVLIPGGGFFYGGYPLAGIVTAVSEIALKAFVLFTWLEMSKGGAGGYGSMAVAAGGLIVEKLISAFYAKQLVQDYVPERKEHSLRRLWTAAT